MPPPRCRQLDAGVDLDDDELERELEELEQNELDEKVPPRRAVCSHCFCR